MTQRKMPEIRLSPICVGAEKNFSATLTFGQFWNEFKAAERMQVPMPKRCKPRAAVAKVPANKIPFAKLPPRIQATMLDMDTTRVRMVLNDLKDQIRAAQNAGRHAEARSLEFTLRQRVDEFNRTVNKLAPFMRKHLHKTSWGDKPYSTSLY